MLKTFLFALLISCVFVSCIELLPFIEQKLEHTIQISTNTSQFPANTDKKGKWGYSGSDSWTSGFFSGTLWHMYTSTKKESFKTSAVIWQAGIEREQNNTQTHDIGFMIFNSFGQAFKITQEEAYRKVILNAAHSLSTRFNHVVGCIKSWNSKSPDDFLVIIDNLMNLELLFWGSKNGGEKIWYDIALSHATKTHLNHIRHDHSSFHVVNYNPYHGSVQWRGTAQGYSNSSTWARGQTWGIYGFTMCYRETGNKEFLNTAEQMADYFLDHLPDDHVPYWDFNAPDIPNEPRDTSAAAISASALLELSKFTEDSKKSRYFNAAKAIIASLSNTPYLSVDTEFDSVLLKGTVFKKQGVFDVGIVYGDYYFVEALGRLSTYSL